MARRDTTDIAETAPTFKVGDRVRIGGNPSGITLRSHLGVVTGPDPEWQGYYLVRLDEPATDWDTDEPVAEIVQAAFNLELVASAHARKTTAR